MRLDPFREGQKNAFECVMTILCPHCHSGYYKMGGTNDIQRDVSWARGSMRSAIHIIDGKRRKCRAAKLIMFYAMIPGVVMPEVHP